MSQIKFALIGASGYIAPRHVEAIKKLGGDLVALLDPYDGIGYIDKYFPNASYSMRFIEQSRRSMICSPNSACT